MSSFRTADQQAGARTETGGSQTGFSDRVREKRLRLVIVGSITVDCSNGELDPMTNAFIQMSGVFAELELRIIRERVRSGMRNARAKGIAALRCRW